MAGDTGKTQPMQKIGLSEIANILALAAIAVEFNKRLSDSLIKEYELPGLHHVARSLAKPAAEELAKLQQDHHDVLIPRRRDGRTWADSLKDLR